MSVHEIQGTGTPIDPLKGRNAGQEKRSKTGAPDKAEVSDQARALYDATQAKKIEDIREKIRNGFYFTPEVTDKVVDVLLSDLQKPDAS